MPDMLGRYRLLGRLGSGGQGFVYEAFDTERQRQVALKVLRTDRGQDARAAEHRLKREFRAAADLNHRNVAKLYELDHDGGRAFCTMELIHGTDLTSHLQQVLSDPSATEEVVRTVSELVLAVSALHEAGLVHRDIKPGNVLVEHATGRVVLLDFGLALSRNEVRAGDIAGTPGFLAPEVLSGKGSSWASDWYGVGVVLYEGLSGRRGRAEPQRGATSTLAWPIEVTNRFPFLCRLVERLLRESPLARPTGNEIAHELNLTAGALSRTGLTPFRPPEQQDVIGRDGELERLLRAYELARTGRPVMVLIRGESGIGKSTLLQAFLARIAGDGPTVLRGICHERELIPFRAIDDVVCRLAERLPASVEPPIGASALCRAFPILRSRFLGLTADTDEELSEPLKPLVDGLRALLRVLLARGTARGDSELPRGTTRGDSELARGTARGDQAPVVLAVEDLQWGDRDSARLMASVLSDPTLPVLMVATWRDTDSGAGFIDAFELALPSQHVLSRFELSLAPLAAHDTLQLLKRLAPSGADLDQLVAASGGVPYVVEELTRAQQDGRLGKIDDQPVERLLARRLLEDCSSQARHFMELLAVAGRPMRQAELLEFAGVDIEAHALLSRLRNQRLIRTTGPRTSDAVDVYHHRIRAAVMTMLAPDQQASHHLSFATGLARNPSADPAQVAQHYFLSSQARDGAPFAERAALLAEQAFAFEQSADLCRQALQYGEGEPAWRKQLQARLARVLALGGHAADAAREYLHCAALTDGIDADAARCSAAENFLASGHIVEGSEALEPLFVARGLSFPRTPGDAMLSLLPVAAQLWLGRRVANWLPHGASVEAAGSTRERSDVEVSFRLDLYWAAAKGLAAVDPVRAGYFLCAGLKTAKSVRSPFAVARFGSLFSAAVLSPAGGGLAQWGRDLLALAESVAKQRNDVYLDALVSVALGQWHLQQGNWQACRDHTERGRQLFARHCVGVDWESNIAAMGLWRALEELGEFSAAESDVESAIAQAGRRRDRYGEVTALLYRAVLRLVRDDLEGAERDAAVVLETWTGHRQLHVQHAYACRVRAMCALARGDAPAAWHEFDALWPRLVRSGMLRSPLVHIDFHGLRARCALALSAAGDESAKLQRLAQREGDRLSKHARREARAAGLLIAAGCAHRRQQPGPRAQLLELAGAAFSAANQPIQAQVCALLQSELAGDGTAVSDQISALRQRGVKHPRRWASVIAPGFDLRVTENSG